MTEPLVAVRPASSHDVDALAGLMVEFYAESSFSLQPAAAARTFTALLAHPELGGVWLLEAEHEPAGFVVLTVAFSMEYGGLRGFVDDFFVAARFRRRGLGALGLQAVKDACVHRGVRALLVETDASNARALSVYNRAGLMDTGHIWLKTELGAALHVDQGDMTTVLGVCGGHGGGAVRGAGEASRVGRVAMTER